MRNRTCPALALAIVLLLPTFPAIGQTEPPGTLGMPLATARLGSVVGMPLYFRLYRVHLPAGKQGSYEGSSALLYALSGAATMTVAGGAAQPLGEGAGAFIAAGQSVTLRASASEPTQLLWFLLTALPNQRRPVLDRPAIVQELFRTPDALPGLQEGPYEFSLARLTLPPGAAANSADSRSGAALDYVAAGAATLTDDGRTETISAGMPLFEPSGWVHRLANPGSVPLVLIQANLSREGAPAARPAADR
jgi:mannose-6-phosphate isomerase-like protein (cupin superfamily)